MLSTKVIKADTSGSNITVTVGSAKGTVWECDGLKELVGAKK